MADMDYLFAVARIRVLEKKLLSGADIEQMIAMPDTDRVTAFLEEKGWGSSDAGQKGEGILAAEEEKLRGLAKELRVDESIFELLSYTDLYQNLKAAIKTVLTNDAHPNVFVSHPQYGEARMLSIVREKKFEELPEHMREAAAEAYEALLTIRDGQLCDVILDRAALTAIGEAGKRSREKILRDYARLFVAVHDIRIAVRSAAAHKERTFLARAIAPSEALDAKRLIETAAIGTDAVIDYLSGTEYRGAAEALQKSATAFDLWCDDHLMEMIKPQKYNSVSSGPVVAYRLARENEIRMARIILTAKANGLPEEAIRERAREMYV